jgi:sulfite reductase alpha subunit-like flavoprotein
MTEDRTILILYGSETGSAKDVAERIGRVARRHHFSARVIGMDAFPMVRPASYDNSRFANLPSRRQVTLIDESLIIFVCSTTGNGVEPANMTPLWKALLRAELPSDLFEGESIGVSDSL